MPSGRLHGSDLPSRFCRHQVLSYVGICHATAPQAVQPAVCLEGLCGQICLCEIRFVAIDLCIRRAGVCRNLPKGKCCCALSCRSICCRCDLLRFLCIRSVFLWLSGFGFRCCSLRCLQQFGGDRRRLLYRIGIILRRDGAFRTAGKCQ